MKSWIRASRSKEVVQRFEQTLGELKQERSGTRSNWNRVQSGVARAWRFVLLSTAEGRDAQTYNELSAAINTVKDILHEARDYATGFLPEQPSLLTQHKDLPPLYGTQLAPEVIIGHRTYPSTRKDSLAKNFRVSRRPRSPRSSYTAG